MLCIAAQRLGYKVHIFSESKDNPAINISDYHTIGNFNELDKIKSFLKIVLLLPLKLKIFL